MAEDTRTNEEVFKDIGLTRDQFFNSLKVIIMRPIRSERDADRRLKAADLVYKLMDKKRSIPKGIGQKKRKGDHDSRHKDLLEAMKEAG